MKFTIIITYFNKKKFIKDCIESVLNQSYINFEIIIIDDFSNESESLYISNLVSYIDIQHSIKLFRNLINSGPSYSRNIGIDKSNGDILIFLDADDKLTKDYLEELNKTFESIKKCEIIITTSIELDGQINRPNYNKLLKHKYLEKLSHYDNVYITENFISTFLFDPIFCGGGNIAIKKSIINNIRFDVKERNFEDWLFFYQICSTKQDNLFFLNNQQGVLYNNIDDNSLSRKAINLSDIKIPLFLYDINISFNFRRYIYFNWLYSTLKRSGSLKNRVFILFNYYNKIFFTPFPIWKFYIPSIFLVFKFDILINYLSRLRKNFKYV